MIQTLTKTNVDDGDENYLIESNYEIDKYQRTKPNAYWWE